MKWICGWALTKHKSISFDWTFYVTLNCSYGSVHILCNHAGDVGGSGGVSKMLMDDYGGGGGDWLYDDIRK